MARRGLHLLGAAEKIVTAEYAATAKPILYNAPPPPPLLAERRPPPSSGDDVWVSGYWDWNGDQWGWIDGRWVGFREGFVIVDAIYEFDEGSDTTALYKPHWSASSSKGRSNWLGEHSLMRSLPNYGVIAVSGAGVGAILWRVLRGKWGF